MASCIENISTKNYQNLISGFQVTVENVGDVFLRHSVYRFTAYKFTWITVAKLEKYFNPCNFQNSDEYNT